MTRCRRIVGSPDGGWKSLVVKIRKVPTTPSALVGTDLEI